MVIEKKLHLVTKLPMIVVKRAEDFDTFLSKQLAKLQTDHLDVYLFHQLNQSQFEKMKNLRLLEKMEEAKAAGKD